MTSLNTARGDRDQTGGPAAVPRRLAAEARKQRRRRLALVSAAGLIGAAVVGGVVWSVAPDGVGAHGELVAARHHVTVPCGHLPVDGVHPGGHPAAQRDGDRTAALAELPGTE
ncbi:hypothetical protein ACFV2X_28300 [Streptomyces sp. NPDC059679]|uniref:hypothetical protein n=1 Tax=Streptomyces sp. NPDC059679 TaxID=3346903 RepID=UPI00367E69AF